MADYDNYEEYSSDVPSPPTPENTPPRTTHGLADLIATLGNNGRFQFREHTGGTRGTGGTGGEHNRGTGGTGGTGGTTGTGGTRGTTGGEQRSNLDLSDLFKLITPILGATTAASAASTANVATKSGSLTVKQRKNITHAFAIAECEQHTDKFLRVLSERESALDVITGRQILSIITVVLPEIQPIIATRLAKLLMLALE